MSAQTNTPTRPCLADLAKGDALATYEYAVARTDLVRYAGASGDFNPIHWSQSTAQAVGLPNVIAHGMLTLGLASRAVATWCGDSSRIASLGARFTKPVVVPDGGVATVAVSLTVFAIDADAETVTVAIDAACDGASVLTKARAVVKLA